MTSDDLDHDAIRLTAYFLWEQDGHPQDRDPEEFWQRALELHRRAKACDLELEARWEAIRRGCADNRSEQRMDDQSKSRSALVEGLKNAHAMESQALAIMKPQAARIENYPEIKAKLDGVVKSRRNRTRPVRWKDPLP